MKVYKYSLLVISILLTNISFSQNVGVINGGMEDYARVGKIDGYYYTPPVKGWVDCGRTKFPRETPPDIHPKNIQDISTGGYWNNSILPAEGLTYLGMVVRENDTWESISQRLDGTLMSGKCYQISVRLVKSPTYLSASKTVEGKMSNEIKNFSNNTLLRIWGSDKYCGKSELLAESPPVANTEWKTYNLKITPRKDHKYITLEAFYVTPMWMPYNGHILLDDLSDFIEISCETNEPLIAEADIPQPKDEPTKKEVANSKPNTEITDVATTISTPTKPSKPTVAEPKTKILTELDRKTIKTGQVIRIKKLYFEADTTSIGDDSFDVLDELAYFLVRNNDIKIEVGGHTNSTPTDEYCDRLSTARAKEVADYLILKGVEQYQIKYKGYGKRKPIASNETFVGRQRNQRVEIKILSMG